MPLYSSPLITQGTNPRIAKADMHPRASWRPSVDSCCGSDRIRTKPSIARGQNGPSRSPMRHCQNEVSSSNTAGSILRISLSNASQEVRSDGATRAISEDGLVSGRNWSITCSNRRASLFKNWNENGILANSPSRPEHVRSSCRRDQRPTSFRSQCWRKHRTRA